MGSEEQLFTTPSVPLCLSSIPFQDVPKYCPVSKNKSYQFTNVPIIPLSLIKNNSFLKKADKFI